MDCGSDGEVLCEENVNVCDPHANEKVHAHKRFSVMVESKIEDELFILS